MDMVKSGVGSLGLRGQGARGVTGGSAEPGGTSKVWGKCDFRGENWGGRAWMVGFGEI